MFGWLKKLLKVCFHNWKYNGNARHRICNKCKKTQMFDEYGGMIYKDVNLTEQEIKDIFKG